jgi:hypothetical protein
MVNTKDLEFVCLDCAINSSELIYEGNGFNSLKDQLITFKSTAGEEVIFLFDVDLLGSIMEDSGDQWTPRSSEITNKEVSVLLKEALVDGEVVSLSGEEFSGVTKLIENIIMF